MPPGVTDFKKRIKYPLLKNVTCCGNFIKKYGFSFESMNELVNGRPYFLIKLPQHVTFFNKGYLIRFLKSVTPGGKLIIDERKVR